MTKMMKGLIGTAAVLVVAAFTVLIWNSLSTSSNVAQIETNATERHTEVKGMADRLEDLEETVNHTDHGNAAIRGMLVDPASGLSVIQVAAAHHEYVKTKLAHKTDLAGLAKTTDLTGLAKTTDLTGLAKTTDLTGLAKSTELAGLAKGSDLANVSGQVANIQGIVDHSLGYQRRVRCAATEPGCVNGRKVVTKYRRIRSAPSAAANARAIAKLNASKTPKPDKSAKAKRAAPTVDIVKR